MRFSILLTFVLLSFFKGYAQLIQNSTKIISEMPPDTIYDTIYVKKQDGTPWNREHFDPNKLLRKKEFDDKLHIGYSYSISFFNSSWGKFSQSSYLTHLGYEFSPNLYVFTDLGLWFPLYSSLNLSNGFSKEDIKHNKVQFVMPDIGLEYKPSENTYLRLMLINETDAIKAYGPFLNTPHSCCYPRNSKFYH